jgi:hypothetical protein
MRNKSKFGPMLARVFVGAGGLALLLASNSAVLADSSPSPSAQGLRDEEQLRKKHQQEYIRRHSTPSGKPAGSEAYIKGMEHVRRMKVAPSIGAQPLGEATPAASSTKAKNP